MATQEMEIAGASAADLSADMENHRKMYRYFLKLLSWTAGIAMLVLIVVFFTVY